MNLNAINRLAQQQGRAPWSLSFSFGRSLQVGGLWCGPLLSCIVALCCGFDCCTRAGCNTTSGLLQQCGEQLSCAGLAPALWRMQFVVLSKPH